MKTLETVHVTLCLLGLIISLYSMHVESLLIELPGYSPACDISSWNMSCSKVFRSSYARPFSHWGLVKRNSSFDFSLPYLAAAYFTPLLFFPSLKKKFAFLSILFRVLSYASIAFNLYLAVILKFVLKEFCLVCVSNYVVVMGLWLTTNRLAVQPVSRGKKLD